MNRNSPYYRSGIMYQWRLSPHQPEDALMAYESALAVDDFRSKREVADCHYKRGQVLRQLQADPDEYIAEFQRAVELNPEHVRAHRLLGVAYYARDKDVTTAESELLIALELAPQDERVYYYLGEIYRQEERVDEAMAMYERALEIAPDFEAARKRLAALRDGK